MAEYAYIQNYSKQGKLGISLKAYEQIVTYVTNKIAGAATKKDIKSPFRFHKPVHCEMQNNQVHVSIQVIITRGHNVDELCNNIQIQVAEALEQMCEVVPFQIKIKVAGIE
ncbi:MAG: Asp23/Gls24 family envelope stress response protein [Bacillales bacterium]|nr:Asp23/Gls24 family envelope stress response protein [Bacillales bacterium]